MNYENSEQYSVLEPTPWKFGLEQPELGISSRLISSFALKAELESRYLNTVSLKVLETSLTQIKSCLYREGINFEGRELPVSLLPTILHKDQILESVGNLGIVRKLLERLALALVSDLNNDKKSILIEKFAPYRKYFDLIRSERRHMSHVQLMRYDTVQEEHEGFKVLETNTCCPGGVIHCSQIRNAYLNSKIGQNVIRGKKLAEYPVDSVAGFCEFLNCSNQKLPDAHNIFIGNYKSTYTYELDTIQKRYNALSASNRVGNRLFVGDIRDLEYKEGKVYYRDQRISLIYNKLDPLQINPDDPEISAWIEASRCQDCEFLNSLTAMYILETKRVLAILGTPEINDYLGFEDTEKQAVAACVPQTSILEQHSIDDSAVIRDRHQYVLKADALTRGEGVFVGHAMSQDDWKQAVTQTIRNNGVVQECLKTPHRITATLDDLQSLSVSKEYFGVDFFFFGEDFAGIVSRCSNSFVFNVGSGGKESPTIVVES